MKLVLLFLISLTLEYSFSKTRKISVPLKDLLIDARGSYEQGDLYRSLKLYIYLRNKKPQFFYKKSVREYINLYAKLSSQKKLEKLCKQLINSSPRRYIEKVNYACGREFLKASSFQLAKEFLQRVKKESIYSVKASLLEASVFIESSASKECLNVLARTDRKLVKKQELEDIYYMTKARCYGLAGSYEEAIAEYQKLSSTSIYYMNSLEETTWMYFKLKDKASAFLVGNIVASSYQGDKFSRYGTDNFVTSISYFNIKHIMAYMDLVFSSNEAGKNKYGELEKEISNYQKSFKSPDKIVAEGLKEINDSKVNWVRLNTVNSRIKEIIQFSRDWVGIRDSQLIEQSVRWQIALNKELNRFQNKQLRKNVLYIKALKKMRAANHNDLKRRMLTLYDFAKKLTGTLALKANIGNIEFDWLDITNGIRNLEAAAILYKEKENYFSENLGD